jgi:Co/Zn/Cd efflux system component
VVAWWAYGLLRQSGRVLLDHQDEGMLKTLRSHLADGERERVCDLHVWSIGPGIHAAEVAIVSHDPQAPDVYKARIPARFRIVHATVEVHRG